MTKICVRRFRNCPLLRGRRGRPCQRRTAEQRNEIAPVHRAIVPVFLKEG
jgi:hypothetical protein